jgi:hypothetical protein
MKLADPRAEAVFVARVFASPGTDAAALVAALLDFQFATDDELARLRVLDGEEEPHVATDAAVLMVAGPPTADLRERVAQLGAAARTVLVVVAAPPGELAAEDDLRAAWGEVIEPSLVHATTATTRGRRAGSTPALSPSESIGAMYGADELRATLLRIALDTLDLPVARARRAKRPYATAIVAGAALAAAGEGLLPGTAAFVVATQVSAIAGLYYLYTGKWLARSQALAVVPAFASEAVGGSLFLLAKSLLPPTGVADAAAAVIAASMTISMLGAITWALERGYSLEEKHQLALAFKRMKARTRAERAKIARSRTQWKDKEFWSDVVRRVLFD